MFRTCFFHLLCVIVSSACVELFDPLKRPFHFPSYGKLVILEDRCRTRAVEQTGTLHLCPTYRRSLLQLVLVALLNALSDLFPTLGAAGEDSPLYLCHLAQTE